MHKSLVFSIALLFGLLLGFSACDPQQGPTDTFDRKAMLENYASQLIKPAFAQVQNQANVLHTAVQSFTANPSLQGLIDLQQNWVLAYENWQYANAYNFGPAGESGLRKGLVEEVGTFPASASKIEAAVSSGQWNMADFNRDARGFLAMEYLIFGQNQSKDAVLAAFVASTARRNMLQDMSQNLSERITEVMSAWNGSYYQEFLDSDGTEVGSSTSILYNEFVRSYESIKNYKLGLPMGKRPGQTQTEPQLVEAYYSGQTLPMLKAHVAAIENIWYGRSKSGQDGVGFRAYLASVEGGNQLIVSTEAQLASLNAALAAVPGTPSISEQITGNNTALEALYVEFSKTTRFFKSDLSSLLGIAITFSSSDGD